MTGKTFDEAKAREALAGDLGKEMTRFPVLFAAPLFFGTPPNGKTQVEINNGTATLIQGDKPVIVTAEHVIRGYEELVNKMPGAIFQIGDLKIHDPLNRIVFRSSAHDLVTLEVTEKEKKEINAQAKTNGGIGGSFYEAKDWPPELPKEGDWIAFGGFPGKIREILSFREIRFDTFSCGSEQVRRVAEDQFTCKFDKKDWVKRDPHGVSKVLDDELGGISGCPVFKINYKPCMWYELVGFVIEYSKDLEYLIMRPAKFVNIK